MTRVATILALAASLVSCSILEPRPDPTRFFVLSSSEPASLPDQHEPREASGPSIGLGPVQLPDYLARPELVRRSAPHELDPSQFERWAEPLDYATARVLAEDLALVGGGEVVRYPWLAAAAPARQVAVDIVRFEPVGPARVELIVNVRFAKGKPSAVSEHHHEIVVQLADGTGESVAAAMSEALLELARRIVADSAP